MGGTGREQQRSRPPPAAETGRRGWGRVLIFQGPAKGLRKNQQTQLVKAAHLSYSFRRNVYQESSACRSTICTASVGRDRTGTMYVRAIRKKQRQGIIVAMVSCLFRIWDGLSVNGMVYSAQQIGSYMWRRIIMNTVRMILCGNVEDSRMNPSEKVGVVSVVFVSTEEEKIKNKLKKLQDKNPEKFYMEYVTPLDVDLTSLEHYPSIEISKNDLQ